jgi:FkbM family methyltransferase
VAVALPAGSAARRLLWRAGRRLYTYARGEGPNDPRSNGEYWLLSHVLTASLDDPVVLLDVGSHRGDWTGEALRLSARPVQVHAFEPSSFSRAILMSRFAQRTNVTVHPLALSNHSGTASFYSNGHAAGTNSLSSLSGSHAEVVGVGTLDEFLQQEHLESIAMIKIDSEGFDSLILRGAAACLTRGAVEVVQFEYNWRWLLNHACLRDIFELIEDKPYRLGKLTGRSVDYYDRWHPELDRFFETNYALVRQDSPLCARGRDVHFDPSNVATIKPPGVTSPR